MGSVWKIITHEDVCWGKKLDKSRSAKSLPWVCLLFWIRINNIITQQTCESFSSICSDYISHKNNVKTFTIFTEKTWSKSLLLVLQIDMLFSGWLVPRSSNQVSFRIMIEPPLCVWLWMHIMAVYQNDRVLKLELLPKCCIIYFFWTRANFTYDPPPPFSEATTESTAPPGGLPAYSTTEGPRDYPAYSTTEGPRDYPAYSTTEGPRDYPAYPPTGVLSTDDEPPPPSYDDVIGGRV